MPVSEMRVPVAGASLSARDVGCGRPRIVLHGGILVTSPHCGHFAYLECGSAVRVALRNFFATQAT